MLILSNERDISVDWVVRLLRSREVPYFRLNTERLLEYAVEIRPLEQEVVLRGHDGVIDLSSLSAVWYRRPDPPELPSNTMSREERDVVQSQWRNAIRGIAHVTRARWINPPDRNDEAEQKLLQLRIAKEIGFNVPSTLITTNRNAADAFAQAHEGSVILKALDAPYLEEADGAGRFFFTTRLRDAPASLDGLDQAPIIFQQEISPKQDVRVTVVGDAVFAAVPVGILGHVDWRALPDPPPFAGVELPNEIRRMSVKLVRRLGLVFGALDLVIDETDTYWFLELNPNGEWGWLQKKVGLPIAEAIVKELIGDE